MKIKMKLLLPLLLVILPIAKPAFGGDQFSLLAADTLEHADEQLSESPHIKGPHGLEGWQLLYALENGDKLPGTLVVSRNGKIIGKFGGGPFLWRWTFIADGKRIAFERGPLHFSMWCVLADLRTAKELNNVDCFQYPEKPPKGGWPSWVDELKNSQ
jgi:hypothetical protein